MRSEPTAVLHIIAEDSPPQRLRLLREYLARDGSRRNRTLALGRGTAGLCSDYVLRAPLHRREWIAITRRVLPDANGVAHAWSPRAIRWLGAVQAMPAVKRARVVADVVLPVDRDLRAGLWQITTMANATITCETEYAASCVAKAGITANSHVIGNVGRAADGVAARARVRAAWRLGREQPVALILPPVTRDAGSFTSAWGGLVAQRIVTDLRILVPECTAEMSRIRRLADATGQMPVLRCTGEAEPVEDLIAAADVAVFLPAGAMTTYAIERAVPCGVRIVASRTEANLAALSQTNRVSWCAAGDRAAASRAVLESIESPPLPAPGPSEPAACPLGALDALYARLAAQ